MKVLVRMKLQRQTQLAMMGYGLMFISLLVLLISGGDGVATNKLLPNIFGIGITIPLTLYIINCTVVGGCKTYAWIHAYVALGVGIIFAIFAIFISAVAMRGDNAQTKK
jgi:hypothetical protein